MGGVAGQGHDLEADLLQDPAVLRVLPDRALVVDRLALEVGQLASRDGGRDVAKEGDLRVVSTSLFTTMTRVTEVRIRIGFR
jgi:hypothetical protein